MVFGRGLYTVDNWWAGAPATVASRTGTLFFTSPGSVRFTVESGVLSNQLSDSLSWRAMSAVLWRMGFACFCRDHVRRGTEVVLGGVFMAFRSRTSSLDITRISIVRFVVESGVVSNQLSDLLDRWVMSRAFQGLDFA